METKNDKIWNKKNSNGTFDVRSISDGHARWGRCKGDLATRTVVVEAKESVTKQDG